jgi:hypothetical protein
MTGITLVGNCLGEADEFFVLFSFQLRLQLEALLAEKSRLAQENADLSRENRSLHQLVEYHQLTSQDLTSSFEEIEGLYLDFSTPVIKENEGEDEDEKETTAINPTY